MKDHFLYPLFKKLRPNEAQLDGPQALQPFVEFFSVVYLAPFALIGLVWLFAVSDLSVIPADLPGFVALFLGLLIIESRPASIPLKLGGKASTSITITLGVILVWSGLFIWGPVALLVDLLVIFILRIRDIWQRSRYSDEVRWSQLAMVLQEISASTLASLIGISVYQSLGGKIPLVGLSLVEWLPAFAAIIVNAFTPAVILLPVVMQINRISNTPVTWRSLGTFMLTVVGVLLVTTPFAVPLTILYTRASSAINFFATVGLVLVNLLLYYLSRINQRSRQRTREMTHLEALGEEIIQAPPDGSTLLEILSRHIAGMFQEPRDILEIRIFEGVDLPGFNGDVESLHLVHPTQESAAPDSVWDDLQKSEDPYLILNNVIPSGARAVYGDAIIDKITSATPNENGGAPVCIGGVYLLRHKSAAKSVDALPAVQALASQVASALYRAQVHAETLTAHKMAQELEFAGGIQASFLPEKVPTVAGWGIAASLTPARQTSGDFYDFIPLGDGKLGIVVADVADKGTGAAIYMALSRTLIRTYAMQYPDRPGEALRQANERILADTRANQFVTVFYAVLDLAAGEMTYCSAGHNPAFVIRADDPEKHDSYIRTGAPMGIFGDLEWDEVRVTIHPGDVLVLYTDGVNEAQNMAEEFYEYGRLLAVAKLNFSQKVDELHGEIIDSLQAFVGDASQFDDITLMVLKRGPLEKTL